MNFFDAVFQGLIQGLTEFLPISSSGHLILIPQIAKWDESLLSVEREERLSGWRQSPKEKLPPGFDLGTKTSQDGTCEDNELSALWQRIRKKAEEIPEGMAELLRSHPKRRRRRKEPVAA